MKAEHTISWSVQPHRKSINLGIFKHPGAGSAPTPKLPSSTFQVPPTPAQSDEASHESLINSSSTAVEKLKSIGLKLISWHGTCEANQISSGTQNVGKNEEGMYALVFDNTFAKQLSKTAIFILLTYPTNAAPTFNHQIHHIQGPTTSHLGSLKRRHRPKLEGAQKDSSDSNLPTNTSDNTTSITNTPKRRERRDDSTGSHFYAGILLKRRRKRHQGYARRFFSLDFASSTLSYYHDRNTLALRGAVPLSLAAIGANAVTREISIDSGAEVWHLRAPTQNDFGAWKDALEVASKAPVTETGSPAIQLDPIMKRQSGLRFDIENEREWANVEGLVGRVAASRDAVRQLAMDTDPKYLALNTSGTGLGRSIDSIRPQETPSTEASPTEQNFNGDFFQNHERRPFWKRKTSSGGRPVVSCKRSVSAQPSGSSSSAISVPQERTLSSSSRNQYPSTLPEDGLHEHCVEVLKDLDDVVAEFASLLAKIKQRRLPPLTLTNSRLSVDSQATQEYFDAEGGDTSQLLTIHQETDEEGDHADQHFGADQDDASASEVESADSIEETPMTGHTTSLYPVKPKFLHPLPLQSVKRRVTVSVPTVSPPSLIGFMRKNVGKDLSTISMPVSANEPISLLQRVSEQMEYSTLLDQASNKSLSSLDRLIYVTTFAISSLSALRVKERAIRKPFNPMLGETFELIREDRGFRFLAEKVSHRPVRMACQAESEKWSFSQSPLPTQKFWGKSIEVITEGRARVVLHATEDHFSWTAATCFLRNIIAGEKYVEPVGSMTITNETNGEHAVVTFKAGGMFSGRSEDVSVQTYDSFGDELPMGLMGKWTQSLTVTTEGAPKSKPLWTVGDLVPDAPKCYGFTAFTSSLNEITAHERRKTAPTDSRLRPDQRAAEDGDIDEAEGLKAKLEQAQRERRKVMEEKGTEWKARWFSKIEGAGGEEAWRLKSGREGYWEERVRGEWSGITDIFAV